VIDLSLVIKMKINYTKNNNIATPKVPFRGFRGVKTKKI